MPKFKAGGRAPRSPPPGASRIKIRLWSHLEHRNGLFTLVTNKVAQGLLHMVQNNESNQSATIVKQRNLSYCSACDPLQWNIVCTVEIKRVKE